jgi:hypothetical protein
VAATRWIRSADGSSALNLDHIVSLAIERESDREAKTYRVVAITVLGSAICVAGELATANQARAWIDDYLTTLAMTGPTGWIEGSDD